MLFPCWLLLPPLAGPQARHVPTPCSSHLVGAVEDHHILAQGGAQVLGGLCSGASQLGDDAGVWMPGGDKTWGGRKQGCGQVQARQRLFNDTGEQTAAPHGAPVLPVPAGPAGAPPKYMPSAWDSVM